MTSILDEIYIAELNLWLGDFARNISNIVNAGLLAVAEGKKIIVTPELSICGYPTEDMVLRTSFVDDAEVAMKVLLEQLGANPELNGMRFIVGNVERTETLCLPYSNVANMAYEILVDSRMSFNKAKIVRKYAKRDLPNYGVFDEKRTYISGCDAKIDFILEDADPRISLAICEDIWNDMPLIISDSTEVLIVPNASPFEIGKQSFREAKVHTVSKRVKVPIVYVNSVGAQDELVFDGGSFICEKAMISPKKPVSSPESEIYNACVIGLRDYVFKNDIKTVALGLSGGIDSALVATMAADAIGEKNVWGILMPSEFSSDHSIADALQLAKNLGINHKIQPISEIFNAYLSTLPKHTLELSSLAKENLQARIRGNILMAFSNSAKLQIDDSRVNAEDQADNNNADPCLVLATGNKSELAVGYSTIYGDAVGGYAPIKDVFKTDVWKLAKWRNSSTSKFAANSASPIPENSITKPPSAELRPDQLDSDSLLDYAKLDLIIDAIMQNKIELLKNANPQITQSEIDSTAKMIAHAEFKRKQYPPGPKVSRIAFGKDWRMPITVGQQIWTIDDKSNLEVR